MPRRYSLSYPKSTEKCIFIRFFFIKLFLRALTTEHEMKLNEGAFICLIPFPGGNCITVCVKHRIYLETNKKPDTQL